MRRDMEARRARVVPAVLHALVACAVLVGVLAMHALSVGHAPATLAVGTDHPHVVQSIPHLPGGELLGPSGAGPNECTTCDQGVTHHRDIDHTGLGLCLAVVAGAVLVWLLALRSRLPASLDLTLRRPVGLSGALSPARRTAPSLSSLCVLRI